MKDFAKILLKNIQEILKKNVKKDDNVSTFSDAEVIVTSSFFKTFFLIFLKNVFKQNFTEIFYCS